MLTAATLAMVLTAQPVWAGGQRSSIRLVQDAPVAEPQPGSQRYPGWTKAQLAAEYDKLAASRPGVGLPIALMVVGGSTFFTAFNLFLLAGGLNGGPGAVPLLVLLGVASTAAAAMIIIGGIVLSRILPERRAVGRQLDEIDQRMETARGDDPRPMPDAPPIVGPPPEGPPPLPLPPMPPPSSALVVPLFLARF